MTHINYTKHELSKEEIDERVRLLINDLYSCCYAGNLTIDKLYPAGYKLSIPLHCNEAPFVIAIEADGEAYFKYLKKALQESALGSIDFSTISSSQETATTVRGRIKGNFDKVHRVQLDSVVYIDENINS